MEISSHICEAGRNSQECDNVIGRYVIVIDIGCSPRIKGVTSSFFYVFECFSLRCRTYQKMLISALITE